MSAADGVQIEADTTIFSTQLNIAAKILTLWAGRHANCPISTRSFLSETPIARSIRFTDAFSQPQFVL